MYRASDAQLRRAELGVVGSESELAVLTVGHVLLRSGSFQSWLEMKYNESKAKSVEEGEIEVEEVEELHKASASLTVHEGRQLRHSGDGGRDVRLVVGSYGLQVRLPPPVPGRLLACEGCAAWHCPFWAIRSSSRWMSDSDRRREEYARPTDAVTTALNPRR